jgi:cell division septal protein FtsQ
LREQVITPRAGRASAQGGKGRGGAGGGVVQRPAKRGQQRGGGAGGATKSWRSASRYVPLAVKFTLAVGFGLALFLTYRAAASASFFQLSSIDVDGAARTSPDEIRAIVRRHVAAAGVWRADLAALGAELRSQPWVRSAVVSRVLPSGVRVRIKEREPRLVLRTSAGRFVWVDDDGVLLGTAASTDKMPPFFIRGLDETPTDAARTDNRERIRRALNLTREWEASGLASRVSEVNLDNLNDVRAQLSSNDSRVEVRLGKDDFGKRLARALKVLDEHRDSPRGPVVRLDATQEKRVIVGFEPRAQSSTINTTNDMGIVNAESQESNDAAPSNVSASNANGDAAGHPQMEARRASVAHQDKNERRQEAKNARRAERQEKRTPPQGARENQLKERAPALLAERPRRVG